MLLQGLRRYVFAFLVIAAPATVWAGGLAAIYPPSDRAAADVKAALVQAAREHKRVLVDFGANWCPDCHALYDDLKLPKNSELLKAHYVLVLVNVSRFNKNVDLADRFDIPLNKGIPALAVVDPDGSLIYSQKNGEFESMRSLKPEALTEFLEKWKGKD